MSDKAFYSNSNKRSKGAGQKFAARELLGFLKETYGEEFIKKIGLIKIDVETENINVLESMGPLVREFVKPVIIVEWFAEFRKTSCNSAQNVRMFNVIHDLGYEAYTTRFRDGQIKRVSECTNEFKGTQLDLVLYPIGTTPGPLGGKEQCSDGTMLTYHNISL